jgi:hypothetical protein
MEAARETKKLNKRKKQVKKVCKRLDRQMLCAFKKSFQLIATTGFFFRESVGGKTKAKRNLFIHLFAGANSGSSSSSHLEIPRE